MVHLITTTESIYDVGRGWSSVTLNPSDSVDVIYSGPLPIGVCKYHTTHHI